LPAIDTDRKQIILSPKGAEGESDQGMETVATSLRFPAGGQPSRFPNPPVQISMTKRRITKTVVRLRSNSLHKGNWSKVARKLGLTLSEFIRRAADAASIEMVSTEDLDMRLRLVREAINAAMSVRTEVQRNQRLNDANSILNTIVRKGL
jgi:hypothetical protein